MCGIIGLVARNLGGFSMRDMEMLQWMSIINTVRGQDSTGFFATYRNKQAEAIKIGTHPFHLFRTKEWNTFKQAAVNRGRMVIGHNRAATRGVVNTENAHPFVENNIILVHNGTLWSHTNLTKVEVEVDSNAIAHALAEKPYQEVLPEINGAWALIWYNTETERLYAARNEDRPLCLIETKDSWVLSSEPWIAAGPLGKFDKKIEDITNIKPGMVLEFDAQGNMKTERVELKKDTARTVATPINRAGRGNNTEGTSSKSITRQAIEDAAGSYGDCCPIDQSQDWDDDIPFEWGTPTERAQANGVPEEIKSLRDALAGKARQVETRKQATSQSCALTSPSASVSYLDPRKAPSPSDKGGPGLMDLALSSEDRSVMENSRHIQVEHPTLVKGRVVLFKPLEVIERTHGRFGFTGKLYQPDELMLDVTGFYPMYLNKEEASSEMMSKYCVWKIGFVSKTVGGLSVFIYNSMPAELCATFAQRNTPVAFWNYALSDCDCMKCKGPIHGWEREFVSIAKRADIQRGAEAPLNVVQAMCPDCIEQTLSGDLKNDFQERRRRLNESVSQGVKLQRQREEQAVKFAEENSKSSGQEALKATPPDSNNPLSTGEPISKEPVGKHGSLIVVPAPKTLQ